MILQERYLLTNLKMFADKYVPPERSEPRHCIDVFQELLDLTDQELGFFTDKEKIESFDWNIYGDQAERIVDIHLLSNVYRRHFDDADIQFIEHSNKWEVKLNGTWHAHVYRGL